MIWEGFTVISPLLAFVCWYAKGKSKLAFGFSAMILAILFNMSFVYGSCYFEMRSILELLVFICGFVVVKCQTLKESIIMLAIGIVLAFVLNMSIPYNFG